jgi:redox-sensitive bicupin YhaK (pirin superfamily)
MEKVCRVKKVLRAHQTLEGAGVKLKRVFGYENRFETDPFLLLDHFGSDSPKEYMAGFPWHPHRGIETVTYMMDGNVEHSDSLGNKGVIGPGDVQWMTAGSGIIHQEMPKPHTGLMYGFQLWVNLPKVQKMTDPRYRDIKRDDISVVENTESTVKVISGKYKNVNGAVQDLFADILYFDIKLWPNASFTYEVNEDYNCMSYVYDGEVEFPGIEKHIRSHELAMLEHGNQIEIKAGAEGARLLLIGGKPLNEKIAWHGPIVMNTEEEIEVAFEEFYAGKFIKYKP